MRLDLGDVPTFLHAQAHQAFADGDADMFVLSAGDCRDALALVLANIYALKAAGFYERALLAALTGTDTNNYHWTREALRWLIDEADRDRLRAAGDPLPPGDPVRLYRGVAGHGRARRIRGLHWTTDLEQAAWFAKRSAFAFELVDPAVYAADVSADAILAAVNDRHEAECLVLLPPSVRPWRLRSVEDMPDGQRDPGGDAA